MVNEMLAITAYNAGEIPMLNKTKELPLNIEPNLNSKKNNTVKSTPIIPEIKLLPTNPVIKYEPIKERPIDQKPKIDEINQVPNFASYCIFLILL